MPTGSKSDYLEAQILDHILGKSVTFVPSSTLGVGLWTATLSDASVGSTPGEPTPASYLRSSVANDTSHWPSASGGQKANTLAIAFPTDNDTGWGTVTYFAICSSATNASGNIYYWGQLSASKAIGVGDTASFAPGQLAVSED